MEINQLTDDLRIIEEDTPIKSTLTDNTDNDDDNDSTSEIFDFSVSDIEELDCSSKVAEVPVKRHSLLIIEEKDLLLASNEDFNNNSNDSSNLIMSYNGENCGKLADDETTNRTINRLNSSDLMQTNELSDVQEHYGDNDEDEHESDSEGIPNEAFNEKFDTSHEITNGLMESDEDVGLVNLLGQINEIVGLCLCLNIVSIV